MKKDKCLCWPGGFPAQLHHTWRGSVIIHHLTNNHQTHNITLISCISCDFLNNDQFLSLRHIKTLWVLQLTRNVSDSVRFLISVLFIWETATVLQSPLTKLEGQFVLFLYSVRIEIKREFPFKLYLRNVNQPGIWGLINFHFPNQIYTIQAVLRTLHLGSCI